MSTTVHVALAGVEVADELVETLSRRGLAVTVVDGRDCSELEIAYSDAQARLHDEVADALRSWLADGHSPLVLSESGDRDYVLRPPGE